MNNKPQRFLLPEGTRELESLPPPVEAELLALSECIFF